MSKLGNFAAACVAVLCAFGLQAATTYTWSGAGDGTSWCEAANWTVGTAVAENYPGEIAVDDAATFPANAEATVVLSGDLTVNAINLNGGDIVVTFKGLDSAAALRVNVFSPGKASAPTTLTFDALELCLGNAVTVYGDTTLKLVNGARFTNSATGERNFVFTNPNCRLEMSGGSSFVSDQHTFCLGENNVIVLDDSQLRVANLYFNYVQKVNASTVTLKGAHPVFEVQTYFQSNNNGNCKGTTEFVFEVPEGGYAEPPLQGRNVKFFDAGNAPNGNAVLTVSADSPALSAGTLTETALAWDWSGVNSAKLVLTETSGATFAWTQADGATASTADANRIFLKAAVGSGEPAPSAVTVSHLSTRPNIVRTARTLTGYGYVIALADGLTTRLTLLVGEEKDKGACTEVVSGVATATGSCALPAWDAPEFEKDYWYFVRCETLDDKGVVLGTSETDLATVRTQDNSTYTWCGGADGNWDDPANWSSSRGADCLGYPQSTASYVQFPVSCIARIHVRRSVAGCLQFNAADQSVVIDDLGSEGPVTVAAGWGYNANAYVRSHLTLEGANLSVTTSGGLYVPTTSVLTVKDGAVFTFGQTNALNSKGRVEVLNGGKIVCNSHIYMGGGYTFVLDNGTFQGNFIMHFGQNAPGGTVEFRGTHPLLLCNSKDQAFRSALANAGTSFEFYLPEEGYEAAPIQCVSTRTIACGKDTLSTLGISVHATRAAISALSGRTVPLVDWPAGIVKSSFATSTDDTDLVPVWSEEANPLTLGVAVNASAHASRLTVAGAPEAFAGGVDPDYGTYELTAAKTCTAPSGTVTKDGVRATCTGYRLYAVDPDTGAKTEAEGSPFAETTRTCEPNAGWTELVWQWKLETDVPSVTVGTRTFAPEKATVGYGEAPEYDLPPDATQAEIQGVVDGVPEGSVIVLADGSYPFASSLSVARPVTLRGSGSANCVIYATAKFNNLLKLNHAAALVEGVTISNAESNVAWNWNAAGVRIDAGTLSHSRVTRCNGNSNNLAGGISVHGSEGRVTHCLVDNNIATFSGGWGGGVFLNAGTLDNSLIVGNQAQAGGGVCVKGGRVVNCTIIGNTATVQYGGGVWMCNSGLLANSIARNNSAPYDGSAGAPDIGGSVGQVINCASGKGYGGGGIAADPQFKDAVRGDYSILISSPCFDAGSLEALLAAGSSPGDTDFAGNLRVTGKTVDVGCYEYDTSVAACAFAADKEQTHLGNTVVLTASVSGFDDADDLEYGWRVTREGTSDSAVASVNPYPFTATEPGRYDVSLTVSSATLGKSLSKSAAAFFYVAPLTNFVTSVKGAPAAFPYGSDGSAATNLADAIAAAIPGSVVSLDRGQHDIGAALFVDKAIEVVGAGMTNTVLYMTKSFSPAVTLNHKDAVFRRLTIAHARKASSDLGYLGVGVMIAAGGGTLDLCRVTDCSNDGVRYTRGGGVYMVGDGRITRCLIDGNVCSGPNCDSGGIYMSSGLVDNSLIVGNSCTFYQYGGAGIAANGGKVVNCTIARNKLTSGAGGGVWKADAVRLINSILADNEAPGDATDPEVTGAPNLGGSVENVKHCLVGQAVGTDPVAGEPAFMDAPNGDFRLAPNSPCRDIAEVGRYLELLGLDTIEDETDLDGMPRLSGAKIDVGAYEYDASKVSCVFSVDKAVAFVPATFTLTPSVEGFTDPEGATLTWTFEPVHGGEPIVVVQTGTNALCQLLSSNEQYRVSLAGAGAGQSGSFTRADPIYAAARTNYVTAAANPNCRFPYATPETAATNLADAVDASVDNATVFVGEGTNVVRQTVLIEKGIEVRGVARDRAWLRAPTAYGPLIRFNHADAVVADLTIANGQAVENWKDRGSAAAVDFDAKGGTLAGCRVTECGLNRKGDNNLSSEVAALFLHGEKAVVTRCVVDNFDGIGFRTGGDYHCGGCGVIATAGRIDNSIISNVVGVTRGDFLGLALNIRGTAVALNCTVVSNSEYLAGGGVGVHALSTVQNTVSVDNFNSAGVESNIGGEEKCVCCLSPSFTSTANGNVVGRPVYREGSLVQKADSPGRNKGSVAGYEDVLFGGTDFYGKRRVKSPRRSAKAKIDIGCAESDPDGLLLLAR